MARLTAALAKVFKTGSAGRRAQTPGGPGEETALDRPLENLRALKRLNARLEGALQRAERVLQLEQEQTRDRAALAAIPHARLHSSSIVVEGTPSERLLVKRLRVGASVERSFSRFVGLTRCATASADVRELWERLLRFERECRDDVLRGAPSTVLDVPGAVVSAVDGVLRISPRRPPPRAGVVAVPRCTFDVVTRKIDNFGHWMLDWAPQVVALWKVVPDATFLLPSPGHEFQRATLALIGLDRDRLVPWDGSPVECGRLLAFESEGRTGGGRPLSPLMELRGLLAPRASAAESGATRRIYVSRRDAPKKRRWIVNEREVEELFRARGFEIVVMRDCTLDEQVRLFRNARIVAGLNGGGLTDIVFSARGIDVVVLLSDTLIRWYAGGGRSTWKDGARGAGQLAALGDSPRFWTHVAAAFEQRCHSFVGGDALPLDDLARFLDDVLAGVDRV